MLAIIKKNDVLALLVKIRRKSMPKNSIRNNLYCRFIQPWARLGIVGGASFVASMMRGKDTFSGVRTIPSPQLQHKPDDVQKILIIKLDHIGDFVLGLPAYRSLRGTFPKAQVVLLCGTWNRALAEQSGLFDHVACLNLFHEASGQCKGGGHFDEAAFGALGLKGFDIAIDFRDNGETRFLLDQVEARFRAGFAAVGEENHMDLAFPSASFHLKGDSPTHHQALQSLLAAAVISATTDAYAMRSVLDKIVESNKEEECYALGRGPLIGINVGSGDAVKNWPLKHFKALGQRLIGDLDATIVLFGSKMQEEDSRYLEQALPQDRVVNKTGILSITQSMSAIRKLDLYIGNDTGTTHIAAGLNIPTICVFSGLTTHESHGAIGERCLSILADKNHGMKSIHCHHVVQASTQILGAKIPRQKINGGWMNFIVIDSKPYKSDFRKYLLRVASHDRANAMHIDCSSGVTVTLNGEIFENYDFDERSTIIAADVKALLGQRKTLVLVGLGVPARRLDLVMNLKAAFGDSVAVYDVFDYFRYDAKGYRFIVQAVLDLATRMLCDRSIVLEKGLGWLYPGSAHLDNASHVSRLQSETPRSERLVYIGSIDRRVNFEWLDLLMALDVGLDIYGKVHKGDVEIGRDLEAFLERNKNAAFYGAYDNDDLSAILGKYKIGLVPYCVDDPMVEHINPDKIYHYLNAGLEVIATPIPQCRRMRKYLHIAFQKEDISKALHAARNQPRHLSWPVERYAWEQRWQDILTISGISLPTDGKHLSPYR